MDSEQRQQNASPKSLLVRLAAVLLTGSVLFAVNPPPNFRPWLWWLCKITAFTYAAIELAEEVWRWRKQRRRRI